MKSIILILLFSINSYAMNSIDHAHQLAQSIHENTSTLDKAMQPGVNVATIGFENSCDFRASINTIQDVIDHPNNYDEIRIVHGVYQTGITITNKNINIRGGYANCANAESNAVDINSVDTQLRPNSGPGMIILSGLARTVVNISNITIYNGRNELPFTSGGINTFNSDLELNLVNVNLSQNNGTLGGGIAILSGNTDVTARNLNVYNNFASNGGGGIYCSGHSASFTIANRDENDLFGISLNQSFTDGGGVLINEGCVFSTWIGTSNAGNQSDFRGIYANHSEDYGGGIHVKNGGKVNLMGFKYCANNHCLGNNTNPVNVYGNYSGINNNNGYGGGISVTGENSQVNAFNALIENNSSTNGAGIAILDNATLTTSSVKELLGSSSFSCWNNKACNQFSRNETFDTELTSGGALYINGNANISSTTFNGNKADYGGTLYAYFGSVDIEASLFYGNGGSSQDHWDDRHVMDINASSLDMRYTTIADNFVSNSIISNFDAVTDIKSSILSEINGNIIFSYLETEASDAKFDCIIASEIDSINLANSKFQVIATDPQFVNRGLDFHINAATSPAVDFCDGINIPMYNDIDNEARGWDDPSVNNHIGPYDIGYDETYENDIIFQQDFDSVQ